MGSSQSNMNPGDLIEVDRGYYKHWTVYIGEDEVVHLVRNYSRPYVMAVVQSYMEAEVKREKLIDVLNGNSYRVNNLRDHKHKPRDPDVIVKEACRMVGQQLKYNVLDYNSKHFVTELRYGKLQGLKPGDLIAIDRGNYNDWAVYIGEDEVVHFVTNDSGSDKTSLKGEVKCEKLSDMLNGNKYQVNNLLDDKYEPHDFDVIVKEAKSMVGSSMYNVVNYNCENFATQLRYGKPQSRQVKKWAVAPAAAAAVAAVAAAAVVAVSVGGKLFGGIEELAGLLLRWRS